MKLVSYIARSERFDRFDTLFNQKRIWADKYDIEEIKDLTAFVARLPTMRETAFLIIDLSEDAETFSEESVKRSVIRLASFTTCRPIFILDRSEYATRLAGLLADERVRNILYVEDGISAEQLTQDLEECLSENGKGFMDTALTALQNSLQQLAIDNTRVHFELPPGKLLQITVAGAKRCCGVTTQCISLAYYLKKIGLQPLVVTFDTTFFTKLKFAFELKENLLNVVSYKDVDIAVSVPSGTEKYNVIIYDFCILQETEVTPFLNADISIVVATSRAWDLADLARVEDLLITSEKKHLLWFNSCCSEEFASLQTWDKLQQAVMGKLPYQPNPFCLEEVVFYHSHLLPVMKEVIGENNED